MSSDGFPPNIDFSMEIFYFWLGVHILESGEYDLAR